MKILVILALILNITLSFSQETNKSLTANEIINGYEAYLAKSKKSEKKLTAKEIIDGYEAYLAKSKKSEKKLTANEIINGYEAYLAKSKKNKQSKSPVQDDSLDKGAKLLINYLDKPSDINDSLIMVCGKWENQDENLSCHDDELEAELAMEGDTNPNMDFSNVPGLDISHCDASSEKFGNYCFVDKNSKRILLRSTEANKKLMQYLCTDKKLPTSMDKSVKNPKLAFGRCLHNQVIETEEINCVCDSVNADSTQGLAWHCAAR